MQDFSLSSRQGVGGAWRTPPYVAAPDAFDERYGHWCTNPHGTVVAGRYQDAADS